MTADLPPLLTASWNDVPGVTAFTTTRTPELPASPDYGDFNLATHVGDAPDRVAARRARLRVAARLPQQPAWLEQVHGKEIVHADTVGAPVPADGSWTATPGVVCAVLTADCLPVVIADRHGQRVAAVHVGWRGLAAGVLEAALQPFCAAGIAPADCRAWFGPAISAAAYEVDARVRDAFAFMGAAGRHCFTPTRPGHWACDLYQLARERLAALGLGAITGGEWCTFGEPRFYSYRRTRRCGRHATVIFIEGS